MQRYPRKAKKFGFWPLFLTAIMSKPVAQKLGETVLLWEEGELMGLAVCHCGPSTEAGNDTCYVKFGAVRSGSELRFHSSRIDPNQRVLSTFLY
jgi:hypothetical protein